MNFNAPEIDYAALSPVIALTAGICVVLLAGVFDAIKRADRVVAVPTTTEPAGAKA